MELSMLDLPRVLNFGPNLAAARFIARDYHMVKNGNEARIEHRATKKICYVDLTNAFWTYSADEESKIQEKLSTHVKPKKSA